MGYGDVEIYSQTGEVVSFDKKNIQDYGVAETSLMPAGLEAQLSVSDMKDLIAYLEAKK
ncbi:MAG: hypothetical protein U5K69_06550 [Balneolaceae bacterium]|nr:hypothetical protein [Balneolaceae bacterium]